MKGTTLNFSKKCLDGGGHYSIEIDCKWIAQLSNNALRGLGIPDRIPFSFEVRGNSSITNPGFRFEYDFINPDYSPVAGWKRNGIILKAGRKGYTLPEPFYSLTTQMDRFNSLCEDMNNDEKFIIWANLKELLPESAIKDDYLHRLEIRRADAFTLIPKVDSTDAVFVKIVVAFTLCNLSQ